MLFQELFPYLVTIPIMVYPNFLLLRIGEHSKVLPVYFTVFLVCEYEGRCTTSTG